MREYPYSPLIGTNTTMLSTLNTQTARPSQRHSARHRPRTDMKPTPTHAPFSCAHTHLLKHTCRTVLRKLSGICTQPLVRGQVCPPTLPHRTPASWNNSPAVSSCAAKPTQQKAHRVNDPLHENTGEIDAWRRQKQRALSWQRVPKRVACTGKTLCGSDFDVFLDRISCGRVFRRTAHTVPMSARGNRQ